ncbi:MAG: glucosamine-6-phosphate isomerase [Spirochaetaceae bacterium]|nr:MAG: glucosamine-6-phosphate isomerase [Spirochaetaceae bacterium]
MDIYATDIDPKSTPLPVEILETDIDLYYHIALTLYLEVENNNAAGKSSVFILPVGPVYQYRRFVWLCSLRPLDLSRVHCFFMDEYLDEAGKRIPLDHPLSFRGFIKRELVDPMPEKMNLKAEQVLFPDPDDPTDYDRRLAELGQADICFAGVGINGHLAFNEAAEAGQEIDAEGFRNLPTRVLPLSRETITINSYTALRGAFERIPPRAVTVGFKQIFASKRVRAYLNRPWQRAVVRKLLFGEKTARFPASLLRDHPDTRLVMTREVAARPEFQLK